MDSTSESDGEPRGLSCSCRRRILRRAGRRNYSAGSGVCVQHCALSAGGPGALARLRWWTQTLQRSGSPSLEHGTCATSRRIMTVRDMFQSGPWRSPSDPDEVVIVIPAYLFGRGCAAQRTPEPGLTALSFFAPRSDTSIYETVDYVPSVLSHRPVAASPASV